MDDTEDLLGKISRQLSEMGSLPDMSVGESVSAVRNREQLPLDPSSQSPYHNLYTWNSLDLPSSRSMSPLSSAHFNGQGSQPGLSMPGYNTRSFAQPPTSNPWLENNYFNHHNGLSSVDPLHGNTRSINTFDNRSVPPFLEMPSRSARNQRDPFPQPEMHSSKAAFHDNVQNIAAQLQSHNPQLFGSDLNHVNSQQVKIPGMHHFGEDILSGATTARMSPPVFDPSTPPPPFVAQMSGSDGFVPVSQSSVEREIFLPSQNSKPKLNLDLGTSIERPSSVSFADLELEDGRGLYEAALEQWRASEPYVSTESRQRLKPVANEHIVPTISAADKSKPSYSDIAKTPRNSSQTISSKENVNEDFGKAPALRPQKKDSSKVNRPTIKRTSSGSKFMPRGVDFKGQSKSRYGLDSFGESEVTTAGLSSSSESLSHITKSRRGSGSSCGSTVSTLDDIPLALGSRSSVSDTSLLVKSRSKSFATTTGKPVKSFTASSKSAPTEEERLFFDPKRIFQSKSTSAKTQAYAASGCSTKTSLDTPDEPPVNASSTLLNNGKPATSGVSTKLSTSARQHDYINNDLRDASKVTNKTAEEIATHNGAGSSTGQFSDPNHKIAKEQRPGRRSGNKTNGAVKKDKRKQGGGEISRHGDVDSQDQQDGHSLLFDHINSRKIEEWLSIVWEKTRYWGNILMAWMLNLLIYSLGLIIFLASGAVHLIMLVVSKSWTFTKETWNKRFASKENRGWSDRETRRQRVGLEENIVLPSTGDEAMKRLLACRGKDPYSILGLRADSSDDEIKKYYRKQAMLVHPDKNQEPGAEEAFKVLGHAFEMIGEPDKRRKYDSHTKEELEADAMREFADMLTKLQTKIQEAANIMRCDVCGGKHRRVPIDRPFYSARFCQQCNIHHQAKEGDVWAESTMLGFYWHYYALMEKHVYDITEWMKCHKDCFKHIKANSHSVMYRISTDGNRKKQHQPPSDANLEDFINRLFNKSGLAGDGDHRPAWSSPGSAFTSSGGSAAPSSSGPGGRKGGRRKKRK